MSSKANLIFNFDSINIHWAGVMNHIQKGKQAVITEILCGDSNQGNWPEFRITVKIKAK